MAKKVTSRKGMIPTNKELTKGEAVVRFTGLEHESDDILVANVFFDDAIVLRDMVTSPCRDTYPNKLEQINGYNVTKRIDIVVTKKVGKANVKI